MAAATLSNMIKNAVPWPDGKRCAVAFTFDMDAESLLHVYHRETAPDRIALSSMLRYGPQVAIPRILEIFARHNFIQTFFVPGWCIEAYPETVESIVKAGHEIGHHGYLHKRPNLQTREQEKESLARGLDAIVRLTGKRPTGYRAPANAFSRHTLELLQEQHFAYDASLFGNDIPYLIGNAAGDLVELPTDLSLDDWPQYVHLAEFNCTMPIASPARAMEVFRTEFDSVWRHGGMWISVWHPFASGRLGRADAMADLVDYMVAKDDVWFASLRDISAHVRHVISSGSWTPRRDTLPFWPQPMGEDAPV